MNKAKQGRNDRCACGSGKKYKQCCLQQQAPASDKKKISIAELVNIGLEHHRTGNLEQAADIYRQALQTLPDYPDALHLLGLCYHQQGDAAAALEFISKALLKQPENPYYLANLGPVYRTLQQPEQALDCYRKALALRPDHTNTWFNQGQILAEQGQIADAITCYEKVMVLTPDDTNAAFHLGLLLAGQGMLDKAAACYEQALHHNPQYADAYNNLGLIYSEQYEEEKAEACYRKALACAPDLAATHNNLGRSLYGKGLLEEAVACYRKALTLDPKYAKAHNNMALVLGELGRFEEALDYYRQALTLAPENDTFWISFAECLNLYRFDGLDSAFSPLLLQALHNEAVPPEMVEAAATRAILCDPLVADVLAVTEAEAAVEERLLQQLVEGGLDPVLTMPLLLAVLEEAIITNYQLERLITWLRRVCLAAANAGTLPDTVAVRHFVAALACQCFGNEYVWQTTEAEHAAITVLTSKLQRALQDAVPAPSGLYAVLGAYRPLHVLLVIEDVDRITKADDYDSTMEKLFRIQVLEPKQELRIRQTMQQVTVVDDTVSQLVRDQYEDNPYPRWRRRGKGREARPLHRVVQTLFPQQRIADSSPASPDVLVAGCGTGRHSVQVAWRFKDARILAVDLSLASLAYAQRITKQYNIDTVVYKQADILKLADLGQKFDLIECGGVLHHLQDPMAGWRSLRSLLRPGGYMKIGLYSRRARTAITAARDMIASLGYMATPQGIRQFRYDLMHGMVASDPEVSRFISGSRDFYSMSACRDLLFHVQEHLFSPLEIHACLEELNLRFLGFELSPLFIADYRARFPEDTACDSLHNWELFEQEHPIVFSGMYQFWVTTP